MVAVEQSTQEKLTLLQSILKDIGSVVVAYSGGVDSAFLAAVAHDVLGERSLAVTASSPSVAPWELEEAVSLARDQGLHHRVVESHELSDPRYAVNDPHRCYFCKTELYTRLQPIAKEEGYGWIANGANLDDLGDYRPGLLAGDERAVRSPLVEARLTKADIRVLSHQRGLPTWEKPAQPCLASRIPYGTPVTVEALGRIAGAEGYLRQLGLRQFRVRHHETVARIEVEPQDMPLLLKPEVRQGLVEHLRSLGYLYVTLDLAGFRTGSLNEVLGQRRDPLPPSE
jgi:uncharacterized protein